MTGIELFFAGIAATGVLWMALRARNGQKRAQAAAAIAQVGTSPVSLLGRVLVTTLVIVGIQILAIIKSSDRLVWCLALALPALVTAVTITRALTVMQIGPARRRRGGRS